jgi:hypothetical protein
LQTDGTFTALGAVSASKVHGRIGADLTVSSNTITVTNGYHRITTNSGNADLTTINGGSDGQILILTNKVGAQFNITSAGNLSMHNNPTAMGVNQSMIFAYNSTDSKWEFVARS